MTRYVIRRLVQFIPVVVIASICVWAIVFLLPGDPAEILAGEHAGPREVEALREQLGLNRSPVVQYFSWLASVLQGDLGVSYLSGHSVGSLLVGRLPATIALALSGMLVGLAIAVPVGLVVALKPRSLMGRAAVAYQNLGLAVPTFWLGLLLIIAFSVKLRIFPSTSQFMSPLEDPLGALRSIALPAIALGVHVSSVTGRFITTAFREAMTQNYIRTARSKGTAERRVILSHAFRNALLPVMTIVGLQFGTFLGGTIVTEVVFNYPGLGRLIYNAVLARDYAVVQGAVLFVVLLFLLVNLIVDLLYAVADPRVRLS